MMDPKDIEIDTKRNEDNLTAYFVDAFLEEHNDLKENGCTQLIWMDLFKRIKHGGDRTRPFYPRCYSKTYLEKLAKMAGWNMPGINHHKINRWLCDYLKKKKSVLSTE